MAFQEKDQQLVEQLKEVKRSRGGMLTEFIAYLQTQVDRTYRELTRRDVFVAGTASVYMSDKYNPYKGTVTFVPNPPGKRSLFDGPVVTGETGWNQQQKSQLRGGEKAVAALAFLIAVALYRERPWILLDEVDAHLDEGHI